MNLLWKHALIIGASSGMGAALARQLARQGCAVALVARRQEELELLAKEITTAGGTAHVYPHDVHEYPCVPALFQRITHELGGLDLVIYAAGVMPLIEPNEYAFDQDLLTVEVNCLGAVAWLNEAAQRFEHTGAGTIVGLSSVAGDRGRRGFPVYGASKAFLNTYLESLRNRIGRFGASVVTIKPGPVDTPMTTNVQKKPLLISAEKAAELILAAARKGKTCAYVPGSWRLIMFIVRSIPSVIFRKLNF